MERLGERMGVFFPVLALTDQRAADRRSSCERYCEPQRLGSEQM